MKRVIGPGLLATLLATVATTVLAGLGRAAGVDFQVQDGQEIPVPGIAFQTAVWSLVGVLLALAFLRWSARAATRFVQTAVALTAVSLVAPFLSGGDAATVATLLLLHLVAAAVMIPALARGLRPEAS